VLSAAGGEVSLTAPNLEFSGGSRGGLVYVTVDGWERAFTLRAAFPEAGQPVLLPRIDSPILRLIAPPAANPGAPLPVTLEVDNTGDIPGAYAELGFDRNNDGQYTAEADEVKSFPGDRRVRLLFGVEASDGCLALKPEVQDWKDEVDASGAFGPRTFRVRLLTDKKDQPFLDAKRIDGTDLAAALVSEFTEKVVLDGTKPEGVRIVDLPKKEAAPGSLFRLTATGEDLESGIREVVFYLGKPGPNGEAPPGVERVKAQYEEKARVWAAELTAPADPPGPFFVTVQFTNGVGLSASDTVSSAQFGKEKK
jgi:hypothetical protein